MQVKEVFLKKIINYKLKKLFIFLLITCLSFSVTGNDKNYLNSVSKYLHGINEFSSSFLQIQTMRLVRVFSI